MASNRGVAYMGPGVVEIHSIDYPKLALGNRKCEHGVILKIVSTNICGSDQHMVRGRTTAPKGLILGHEITGEVIEAGRDVEFIKVGDLVSVPFNIACGRCRNCKERATGICLNVNPARPGAAYGYVDMGGWVGGQADYIMVPYADFNLLKFPDKAQAMAKIRDLTCLSDILPTGYHGAVTAGVGPGATVYVAGAGPVGLACAAACQLLGAAVVIVGDLVPERLAQARSFGCETVDVSKDASVGDQIAADPQGSRSGLRGGLRGLRSPWSRSRRQDGNPCDGAEFAHDGLPARAEPSAFPGLYVTEDPGAADKSAQTGNLSIRIGLGWAKSHVFTTGQCPVMKYNRQLMMAILHDKIKIAKAVNVTVVTLDQAVQGYKDFDKGAAKKFVLDPHGMIAA